MTALTRRSVVTTATGLFLTAGASSALAEIRDYEFQLVQNEVKKGDAIVAVRLINKRSKKAVPDAVISAKRIDMAPDGMAAMASSLEEMPSTEPGVYRFKTDLSMAGRWQLSLAAKVQGETGTVQSKVVLRAVP
jgi:YtkA-like protein